MAVEKKKSRLPKIFKNKLFIASLAFYILVPVAFLLVIKLDAKKGTAGNYYYYENGQLSSKITLTIDNKATITFYSGDYYSDKEYTYRNDVNNWTYRESAWKDHYDPEKFTHLSLEYVRFGGKTSDCYFIYFKIGNKLYSDFLIDEARGGGQKCYIKK